jgi:hypothetical protein
MFSAITQCFTKTVNTLTTWLGLLSGAIACSSDLIGRTILVPSTVYWLAALVLMFITACRAYWELEKATRHKPTPTVRLKDVIARMLGRDDYFKNDYSGSNDVVTALFELQEKAINGNLSVYGRKGWRTARPTEWDGVPRVKIPTDELASGSFEYLFFFHIPRAVFCCLVRLCQNISIFGLTITR